VLVGESWIHTRGGQKCSLGLNLLLPVLVVACSGEESGAREVAAVRARDPLNPAPLVWSYQRQLLASDGMPDDAFGNDIALSGDTAIVGAYADDVGTNVFSNNGSAFVFVRSGGTWTQQAKLPPQPMAADSLFGVSVDISGDTAVIGVSSADGVSSRNEGAAFVYVRSGTTWTEQTGLFSSDHAYYDYFGGAVAISGDTIVVGAYQDDLGFNGGTHGSAYVFVRSGTTWTEQAKLIATNPGALDRFGAGVAISGDTVVVGAHSADRVDSRGFAHVYVRSGTTWTNQQRLSASDATNGDGFGRRITIVGDTIIFGCSGASVGANAYQGAAYVFTRSGTTWTETAKLVDSAGTLDDFFGNSVTLSGDTAAIGAYGTEVGSSDYAGVVHIFTRSGTQWTKGPALAPPDARYGLGFGEGLALEGDTIVVGATELFATSSTGPGAAYVFNYGVGGAGGGGAGGAGGLGGAAGNAGAAGSSGAAGNGGVAGSSGAAGNGGSAGRGGTSGDSGASGEGPEGGAGGEDGDTGGTAGLGGNGIGGSAGTSGTGAGASGAGASGSGTSGAGHFGSPGGVSESTGCDCKVSGPPARRQAAPWLAMMLAAFSITRRRRRVPLNPPTPQ
jgi:MYXO-CTERM domain-containing protein